MAGQNGKTTAREKAETLRRAELAEQRKRRQLTIGAIVAAVVVAAVIIGIAVSHSSAQKQAALGTGPLMHPAGAVADGMAIPFGSNADAKVVLTIYEDFRCPFCRDAEQTFESVYKPYANDGKIQVQYHLVNLIDRNDGGTGSIQAGNAGACAQDAGKFEAYHDVLYANQPDENDDAYGDDDKLISLAKQVPGLDTPAFEACVRSHKYGSWVVTNFNNLSTLLKGQVATPYYGINGTQFPISVEATPTAQSSLKAALDKAVAAAG